jgi:hypothetical protein
VKTSVDRWLVRVLCVLLCLSAAGCGRKNKNITKANFEKIKPGMSVQEVEAILGGADEDVSGELNLAEGSSVAGAAGIGGDLGSVSKPRSTTKWLQWGTEKKHIRVGFDNGKVTQGKIQSQGL